MARGVCEVHQGQDCRVEQVGGPHLAQRPTRKKSDVFQAQTAAIAVALKSVDSGNSRGARGQTKGRKESRKLKETYQPGDMIWKGM